MHPLNWCLGTQITMSLQVYGCAEATPGCLYCVYVSMCFSMSFCQFFFFLTCIETWLSLVWETSLRPGPTPVGDLNRLGCDILPREPPPPPKKKLSACPTSGTLAYFLVRLCLTVQVIPCVKEGPGFSSRPFCQVSRIHTGRENSSLRCSFIAPSRCQEEKSSASHVQEERRSFTPSLWFTYFFQTIISMIRAFKIHHSLNKVEKLLPGWVRSVLMENCRLDRMNVLSCPKLTEKRLNSFH